MWEDSRGDIVDVVRSEFLDWLRSKGVGELELGDDDAEATGDGWKVDQVVASEGEHSVVRLRLDEDSPLERWTTTIHVLGDPGGRYVWIDLERVSEDVYDRPPDLGSPRIVRRLAKGGHATNGNLSLDDDVMFGTSEDIPGFGALLRSQDRTLPIVVFAAGGGQPLDEVRERADLAAKALCGVARVCIFPATAVAQLKEELGGDLQVRGRSVRTFLPDVQAGPSYRHRFIPSSVVERYPRAATNRLTRELFPKAAAARPPRVYREHVRPMLMSRSSSDDEAWELAFEQQKELDQLQDRLDAVTLDLEIEQLQLVETQGELQDAHRTVRYLRAQVGELGGQEAYARPPDDWTTATPASNAEVVDLAREHLQLIVLGSGIEEGTSYLDDFPSAPSWAVSAWRGLMALNRYAELRRDVGAIGDFRAANRADKLDTFGIQDHWIAMHESQTTRQDPRYRAQRTFAVPDAVDPSGQVFMAAHLKLKQGGVPAPRIHFHDDTAGTGKIYVGHYGDHLTNQQTN